MSLKWQVAIKPVEAASGRSKANEAVKESISNEIKMNELVTEGCDRSKESGGSNENVARITEEKVKPMEGALKRANGAMTAYDNAEKVHKARLSALAKDLESQSADATAKKAPKFAAVAGTTGALGSWYRNKVCGHTKRPTKTASK